MRNFYVPTLLLILLGGCASSTHQMNLTPQQQNGSGVTTEENDFIKERIAKENYEKGLEEGIRKGFSKASNIITKEYLPYIKRLEAGKYAMRKGYFTPPEVMVFQNPNGTLNYRATGCKIEKELDVNDIFKRFGESVLVKDIETDYQNPVKSDVQDSSYSISDRDRVVGSIPMRPGATTDKITKRIEKTTANKLVLDQYNVSYSESDGIYLAVFSGPAEMEGFCSQFNICSKD